MLKIGICDDDINVLKSIVRVTEAAIITLNFNGEITLVTSKQNLIYDKIKEHEIDILFLDIDFNNSGRNGIEFATELRKVNKDFKLIFITGHFEYSMLAFKCKTFDYILKPADKEKLISIFQRLIEDVSQTELGLVKISKDYFIRTKDILFIERNKSKATIHTKDNVYETCLSLNTIQKDLPDNFVRVHRSYIINPEQVVKINKAEKAIYFDNNISCPMGQFNFNI